MPPTAVPGHVWRAPAPGGWVAVVTTVSLAILTAACASPAERAGGPTTRPGAAASTTTGSGPASSTTTTPGTVPATASAAPATVASAGPGPVPGPSPAHASSTVARAAGPSVAVFREPGPASALTTLANPQPSGAPLVLLVKEQRPGWLHVLLPVRPNGSSGWVAEGQVTLSRHDFQIIVELGAHRITVFKGADRVLSEPVGVGRASAPTPGGTYYLKELLQPPDPHSPYGPYAYGLSGFSNVLTRFRGGDGVIGIHGTNDPSSIGRDVSAGCIRMSNTGITRLAGLLPLGVPVDIRP